MCSLGDGWLTGNTMPEAAAAPGALSTSTRPPWASAVCLTRNRPRP